jgi:hypothetical protein
MHNLMRAKRPCTKTTSKTLHRIRNLWHRDYFSGNYRLHREGVRHHVSLTTHTHIYISPSSLFLKIQRNRFHYGHRVFCHLVSSPILYTHSCIREAGNMSIAFLSACPTPFARSFFAMQCFFAVLQIAFLLTIDCLYWAMKAWRLSMVVFFPVGDRITLFV